MVNTYGIHWLCTGWQGTSLGSFVGFYTDSTKQLDQMTSHDILLTFYIVDFDNKMSVVGGNIRPAAH